MKYKISLSTYNPTIVEALSDLGYKKSQFLEHALINFLRTKEGKTTLRLMVHNTSTVHHHVGRKMISRTDKKPADREEAAKISIDSFLE